MKSLGQIIREIQREAAGLPTGDVRATLQASLELLTEYTEVLQKIRPAAASAGEKADAANDVLYTALFTALYVQELATRPVERFARVRLSVN
jgi:hypothetical protein